MPLDEPGYGGGGRGHAPPPHVGDSRGAPPPRDMYGGAPPSRGGDSYGGSGELSLVPCCHDSSHCACVVGNSFSKLYASLSVFVVVTCKCSSTVSSSCVCVMFCLVLENFHVIFVARVLHSSGRQVIRKAEI